MGSSTSVCPRCSSFAPVTCADARLDRALGDADRHGAGSQLEPRQHHAEHEVEPLPRLAEQLAVRDRRVERHRRARVAAEPEALPRADDSMPEASPGTR